MPARVTRGRSGGEATRIGESSDDVASDRKNSAGNSTK
jgi:hypothetical protein